MSTKTASYQLRTLGTLDLRNAEDHPVQSILAQPKRTAVLAYLALATPRGFHRRDRLLGIFWPELDDERARAALNKTIHYLRRSLSDAAIQRPSNEDIGIDGDEIACDAVAFERALDEGRPEEALELYGGDLLPGFFVTGAPEFERWLDAERIRLRKRAVQAAWVLAETAAERGDRQAVAQWAQRARVIDPEDERVLRWLVAQLDRAGDRAGALAEYEAFARWLREEYSTEPSPETIALIEEVRARQEAYASAPPPVPTPASDAPAPAGRREHSIKQAWSLPPLPEHLESPFGQRRWYRFVLGATAVIGVLVLAWGLFYVAPDAPAETVDPATVAVLPFGVHGSERLDYLREGLPEVLAAGLSGSGLLRTVNSRAVLNTAADSIRGPGAAAVTLARSFGAGLYVTGDVLEAGGRIRIEAAVHAALEEPRLLQRVRVEGETTDLFALTDELTRQVLAAAGGGIPDIRSVMASTGSSAALEAYLRGQREFHAGRYTEATLAFSRAVRMDSTFALAYRRLSNAANWTGEVRLADWASAQAVAHSDDLPERERLHIRAWDAYLLGRADTAAALYRRILETDSLDAEAWTYLAETLYHWLPTLGSPASESREAWERAIALDPDNAGAMIHLARLAALAGDRSTFDQWVNRLRQLDAGGDRMTELEAIRAFTFGDLDERRKAAAELARIGSDVVQHHAALAAITLSSDLAGTVEYLIPQLLVASQDHSGDAALNHLLAAHLYAARGQTRSATMRLDTVDALVPAWAAEHAALLASLPFLSIPDSQRRAARAAISEPITGLAWPDQLYLAGMISIRMGDVPAARQAIRALEDLSGPAIDTATARTHVRRLRAELLRRDGRSRTALAVLGPPELDRTGVYRTIGDYAFAHERWLRGELNRELGRNDEAFDWYATFPDPQGYDFLFLAPSHLRRAELLQQEGDRLQSGWHCARARAIWRDADAGALVRAWAEAAARCR